MGRSDEALRETMFPSLRAWGLALPPTPALPHKGGGGQNPPVAPVGLWARLTPSPLVGEGRGGGAAPPATSAPISSPQCIVPHLKTSPRFDWRSGLLLAWVAVFGLLYVRTVLESRAPRVLAAIEARLGAVGG